MAQPVEPFNETTASKAGGCFVEANIVNNSSTVLIYRAVVFSQALLLQSV